MKKSIWPRTANGNTLPALAGMLGMVVIGALHEMEDPLMRSIIGLFAFIAVYAIGWRQKPPTIPEPISTDDPK